jgi:hypothetical protein
MEMFQNNNIPQSRGLTPYWGINRNRRICSI